MKTASWIIYNTMTTEAVFETFEENTGKAFANGIGVYRSMPALEWLQMINAGIKMMMHSAIDIGTRVQFSAQHCRNTGQFAGDDAPTDHGPWARGEVIAWHKLGKPYVMVRWDNGVERGCNGSNLWPCGIPEPA